MQGVTDTLWLIAWPLGFLVGNCLVILFIFWHSRRPGAPLADVPMETPPDKLGLDAGEVLGWEFEYARTTASESMQDRHTMINFYLLVVGVVASGVVTLMTTTSIGQAAVPRNAIGAILLWLLCVIGWFYFLSLIRLRQAWYDSARAMNRIKDFCIRHAADVDPNVLRKAFLWQPSTVPVPGRAWTVFFYAAMLIGLLNGVAYTLGSTLILIELNAAPPGTWLPEYVVIVLGLIFFGFHLWMYFAFLALRPASASGKDQAGAQKETTMPTQPNNLGQTAPRVKILEESDEYAFGDIFRIVRAKLQYRRFDGRLSEPVVRINFERGDSVGVLLYDASEDAVVLVRQFRYPVYAGLGPRERNAEGAEQAWLLEIVAGVKDSGLSVAEVAKKELLEEAGYVVTGELQPITTLYPSPGGSSERIHLYLGSVDQRSRSGAGGGVVAEGEDTQIVVLPLQDALDKVARGEIRDAKTIVALQHLALQKLRGGAKPSACSR